MLPEHTENTHDAIMYVAFLNKVPVAIFRKKDSTRWWQRRKPRHDLFWPGRVPCLPCTVSHFLVNFKDIYSAHASLSFLTVFRNFSILA